MMIPNNGIVSALLCVLFFLLLFERIQSTFLQESKLRGRRYYRWLTVVPLITYLLIVFIILYEGFLVRTEIHAGLSLLGLVLYGIGIFLRRLSQKALGDYWSVHIEIKPNHRMIRSGIYRYLRHPYTASVLFELSGFSLIFQSWAGLGLTFLIQAPLLVIRNRMEEKVFEEKLRGRRMPRGSFLEVIRRFGIGRLIEFISVNRAMKKYSRYYMLTRCMASLLNVGFFDALQEKGSLNIRRYAAENKLDFTVLNTLCGYLMSQGVIGKRGKTIRITRKGKFLTEECRGVFGFVSAYQPIFDNLESMLRSEKKYGEEILKRPEYVAQATADLAKRFTFPIVKSVISKRGFRSVLDLGCGSGEFLTSLSDLNGMALCGIDISGEAVDVGKKKYGNDRLRLEICDLLDLDKLKVLTMEQGRTPEVITALFVFHEFVHDGVTPLVRYLRNLRKIYPSSYLLVYELFMHKWHKLRRISSAIREHHLFHYLSNQGLLGIGNWHNVFRESGYHIIEEKSFEDFGQGYFLLKP